MRLFKKKLIKYEEPYAFEPGKVYVMEVAGSQVTERDVAALEEYYEQHNITMHIVITLGGHNALYPVKYQKEML